MKRRMTDSRACGIFFLMAGWTVVRQDYSAILTSRCLRSVLEVLDEQVLLLDVLWIVSCHHEFHRESLEGR